MLGGEGSQGKARQSSYPSGDGLGFLRNSSIRKGLRLLREHRLCGHGTQDSSPTPPAAICVLIYFQTQMASS